MYKTHFTISNSMLNKTISISEKLSKIISYNSLKRMPTLRRNNKIKSIMKRRIEKILSLMVNKNPQVIVLGAWGCGAFGNQKDMVFNLFEDTINEIVPDSIKLSLQ